MKKKEKIKISLATSIKDKAKEEFKKNIKANYRFHYKQPMPGVDCSLFNMHQALYLSPASPPLPKRQLHTDLAHCS